jgi:hypothetical protein
VLIVLWLVSRIPNPLFQLLYARLFSPSAVGQLAVNQTLLLIAWSLLSAVVAVAVAVWLFRMARRDGASPWVWCMFGLFFSVVAVILYLVLQIYERQPRPPLCRACRYDLRGTLLEGKVRCPECGEAVPEEWNLASR